VTERILSARQREEVFGPNGIDSAPDPKLERIQFGRGVMKRGALMQQLTGNS
jgi:hypothetical protein